MSEKYTMYPLTVKALADEIIRATNDYRARQLSNAELRELITWYAATVPGKLFNGADYNPTIKKIIGQRRIELLDTLLNGYQQRVGGL